jgi:hypothetical protein
MFVGIKIAELEKLAAFLEKYAETEPNELTQGELNARLPAIWEALREQVELKRRLNEVYAMDPKKDYFNDDGQRVSGLWVAKNILFKK